MAILKQKLNRKNESGTYDEIHLKTDASNVSMSTTDETLLSTKISNMDTAIAGKQPVGSYAAASHNHSAANITSGTLDVARGGTGQTSVDTTPTSGSKKMCTSGGIYTAINELKTSVSNGKSAVASAITDKGVSTSVSDSFSQMATNINQIKTGINGVPVYGTDFTYTGNYQIISEDDSGNWKIKFLTSGIFTAMNDVLIDIFAVGGGGS